MRYTSILYSKFGMWVKQLKPEMLVDLNVTSLTCATMIDF